MSAEPREREAVRTTIVGGRPPGSGRSNVTVPRGIEVLVKKAAVDDKFRELLFERRGDAAAAIELQLDPAEDAMLSAIPKEQLAQIIAQTTVPDEQRRVFLGRIAAAMLAVLGAGLAGCNPPTRGVRPDHPESKSVKPVLTNAVSAGDSTAGSLKLHGRGGNPSHFPLPTAVGPGSNSRTNEMQSLTLGNRPDRP